MAIIALAGRRVDAPGAPARLPEARCRMVREQIRDLLSASDAAALVCSAACGADLLALEAAEELGLRARIVLPFSVDLFRTTSVTDRGGDWGLRYDRQIQRARPRGDILVLPPVAPDQEAYARANTTILDQALQLAHGTEVIAAVVWEGQPRGPDDLTAAFADAARARDWPVREIRSV
jgi:hypothetical protein